MEQKRIAIMQPYFFPYIGYFQLLHAVDAFVLYDNIEYTKKGWINRNRILEHGADATFSIPLQKASDYCLVSERNLSDQFDRDKLLNRMRACYGKAPEYGSAMNCFLKAIKFPDNNLFRFIKHSLAVICDHLAIRTPIIDSSIVQIDHSLCGQQKVLAICQELNATTYVNAIGGTELYDSSAFEACGVELKFIQSTLQSYRQFDGPFVPWLSILDVMMFNEVQDVREMVQSGYALIGKPDNDR